MIGAGTGAGLAVLLGIAAVLAGVVVWEVRMPAGDAALPEARAPAAPEAAPRLAAASGEAAGLAATLLARPPFSPERRPPGPGALAPALAEAPLPRLMGILVTPEARSAIFAGQPQPLVVREGGIVGRFSVQGIEPGQVTLRGPDGARILRPAFDASAAPPRPGTLPPVAVPGLPQLPGGRLVPGGGAPPVPGTFPSPADAPQDAMPFDTMTAPTGAAILHEQARRDSGPAVRR